MGGGRLPREDVLPYLIPGKHSFQAVSGITPSTDIVVGLQVDGAPFHFAGFNNYYMPTYAADPNLNERTQDVDVVFA